MTRVRPNGAFTLTELLVVIAIILILVSLLVVSVGGVYSMSVQVNCQHRLEQILQASTSFAAKNHGKWPRSYDPVTFLRWYDSLLAGYVDNRAVLSCPAVQTLVAANGPGGGSTSGSTLPVLLYNTGTGRLSIDNWDKWGTYATLRDWLHTNLPYDVICPQCDDTALVPFTMPLASAGSQVWFLNTEAYEYKQGQNVFESPELTAMHDYNAAGGGMLFWSESYRQDDYYRSTNNTIEACEKVGLKARPIWWSGGLTWEMNQCDHPTMKDGAVYITKMQSAYSPAYFTIENNDPYATIVGTARVYDDYLKQWVTNSCALIATWDNGTARMIMHGSYTSLVPYGGWPYGDIQRFCLTSDKWLRVSGGLRATGNCTYGYNNQIGVTARTPSGDTIVVMDYENWEIDRDTANPAKNDDPSFVALRHGGRANAGLADGRVKSLTANEVRDSLFTPQPGD